MRVFGVPNGMDVSTLLSRRSLLPPLLTVCLAGFSLSAPAAPLTTRLAGHVPQAALSRARLLGRVAPGEKISLALALPLRNQARLDHFLRAVQTPGDPNYGHFLTPAQFTAQFGPTPNDYAAVAAFARRSGLTVTGTHPNRLLLDVSGTGAQVEAAFSLHLRRYQSHSGRIFRAPDADPAIPAALAGRLAGVIGLDTASQRRSHLRPALGSPIGTGEGGGLSPADTQKAYGLSAVTATGAGQSLALFELDGYAASDIVLYAAHYELPSPPLQTVLVDGASGVAGANADEVTLDIELALAAAPGLSKVLVYETPNDGLDSNILDGYNRIATDNLAKQVATSWGGPEDQTSQATLSSENQIFQQMAAQGQSVFAAGGDNGAYDDGSALSVDDPSSQPYVTGIGGTTLALDSSGNYLSESAWSDPTDTSFSPLGSGSGGGFSQNWPVPAYQAGLQPTPAGRSVPDVSLDANPNTGYSVYYGGNWVVFGGTSAAVPFWAGLAARVNQERAALGLPSAGFLNPAIYQIGASAIYDTDFHDITTGTNLYYPAKVGYDNATGWGTPVGNALINTLVNGLQAAQTGTVTGVVTASDTGLPIAGATVSAASQTGNIQEPGSATTDANGNYILSVSSGLSLDITVNAYAATGGRYAGAKSPVTVAAGQAAPVNFALQPTQTFAPGIQMISAPYDFTAVGDFAALFGLTLPLPASSPRLIHWDPDLNSYLFYPYGAASTLSPGLGYWVNFPTADFLRFDGQPVPAGQPFSVSLSASWNQIGDPFFAAAPIASLTVNGLPVPSSPLVSPTLYRYAAGGYVALNPATDALQPYVGYWIYTRQPVTLTFPPP